MCKISGFLGFCWILLIELGPGTLCFAKFLEGTLMGLLLVKFRVLVDLFILILESRVHFLKLFRVAQSSVEHTLIISHKSHFTGEAFVPVILRARINILLLLKGCCVRLISSCIVINLRILSQIVEEGSFLISWLIDLFESSRAV